MTAEGSAESPAAMADADGTTAGGLVAASSSAATATAGPSEQLRAKIAELQGHIESGNVWNPNTAAAAAAAASVVPATAIAEAPPAQPRNGGDPAVAPMAASTRAPVPLLPADSDGEADEWREFDDGNGRRYLHNTRTNKTKWADPPPLHRNAGRHHGMMNTSALRIAIPGDSATGGARGGVRNNTLLSEDKLASVGGWLDLRGVPVPTKAELKTKSTFDREYEGVSYGQREDKSKVFGVRVYIRKELAFLRTGAKSGTKGLGEKGRGCWRRMVHQPRTNPPYRLAPPRPACPQTDPRHTAPCLHTPCCAQARTTTSCRRRHCSPWLSGS